MPFQINYTQVPIEKQSDQRFLDLFYWMQDRFADLLAIEELCFHEGGHLYYYNALGATHADVDIPHITYDAEHDEFDYTNGGVQNPKWDDAFTKMPILNQAYYMAIVGAAGELVATTLLGRGFGTGEGDKQGFHGLCQKLGISYNQEVKTWRTAEEYVRKDLQNSTTQDGIRATAKNFEPLIFKPL
jgi:hypothetical protein